MYPHYFTSHKLLWSEFFSLQWFHYLLSIHMSLFLARDADHIRHLTTAVSLFVKNIKIMLVLKPNDFFSQQMSRIFIVEVKQRYHVTCAAVYFLLHHLGYWRSLAFVYQYSLPNYCFISENWLVSFSCIDSISSIAMGLYIFSLNSGSL